MTTPLVDRFADALVALTPERPGAIENLRPLYTQDMRFQDPIQTLRGLDAFLAMNVRLVGRMRELRWEVVSRLGDDRQIFLEWVMHGAPKLGPHIEVAGTTRARVEGGRIVDHRDYWDVGEMFASSLPGGQKMLHFFRMPLA